MWIYKLLIVTSLLVTLSNQGDKYIRPILKVCQASYRQGSLEKPCGYCRACKKKFDQEHFKSIDDCTKLNRLFRKKKGLFPLEIVRFPDHDYCFATINCFYKLCACASKEKCIDLFGSCKCRCTNDRYGRMCEHVIPRGFSTKSFADLKNIIYPAYIYSSDFANFTLFFYNIGTNFSLEVQTERELLVYDADICKRDFLESVKYCDTLYKNPGINEYQKPCKGGSSFSGTPEIVSCHMTIYLAFPRIHYYAAFPDEAQDDFLVDYYSYANWSNQTVAGHSETVTFRVYNKISAIGNDKLKTITYETTHGLLNLYEGKSASEICPPRVIIEKHAKTMFQQPKLLRRNPLTLKSTVIFNNQTYCKNVGGPVYHWLVWLMHEINHDEKNDTPFFKSLETDHLFFEAFFLDFGSYKVKCRVTLTEGGFNTETTYAYFKIIKIPVKSNVIGGDVRYVYYKSNFELISKHGIDPNFPKNKQPQLKTTWSCNATEPFCKKVTAQSPTVSGPFPIGNSYEFTMQLENPQSRFVGQDYQVIVIVKDPIPGLLIYCLKNCVGRFFKSDPRQYIYLEVRHSQFSPRMDKTHVYNWTCFKGENRLGCDMQEMRQKEDTPSRIFIIEYDTLETNEVYSFRVVGGGEPQGCAEKTISTYKTADTFNCTVEPPFGTAGRTKFLIKCTISDNAEEYTSITFIFYDLSNETDIHGRAIGYSYIPEINEVILTKGTVCVRAANDLGQYQETFIKVPLTAPGEEINTYFVEYHLEAIRNLSSGSQNKISLISGLIDLLNVNKTLTGDAIENCLEVLTNQSVTNLLEAEMLLTTTQSVVCYEDDCKMHSIPVKSYMHLSKILSVVAKRVITEIKKSSETFGVPFATVKSLYRDFLTCAEVMIGIRDETISNKSHSHIAIKTYKLYRKANVEVMRYIGKLNEVISIINHLPYVEAYSVATENIKVWIKNDDPYNITSQIQKDDGRSFISVSPKLAKYLKNISSTIVLQFTKLKDLDPFWWSLTDLLSTEIVTVSLGEIRNGTLYKAIDRVGYPIDVFLKINNNSNATVTGEVTQPDPRADYELKDSAVSVHRVHLSEGASSSLKFIDLNQGDEFKVLLLLNLRPYYDLVLSEGTLISNTNPFYHSTKQAKEEDDFIYVGILPGENVTTGKTLRYKFQLGSVRCQTWHDIHWASPGCIPGSKSTSEFLHCRCNHLSTLSGFVSVPINTPNPYSEYMLLLNTPDNPLVFVLIALILLSFLSLLILAALIDKKRKLRMKIIVLEDNMSSDKFGYIVIVFTGSRLCAGTTSNIGIMLQGTKHNSRVHILRSSDRRTLQRGNDDWFLMSTPWLLGGVSFLHLWTDHSGPAPNWFCSRIVVHDLQTKKDYTFRLGKWFGVTQLCGVRVQTFTAPVKIEDGNRFVNFLVTNLTDGFRESHLWLSVIYCHPRSHIYVSQRVSMLVVSVLATLLASIMFYEVALPHEEDAPAYLVDRHTVLISIYSLLISMIVTLLVYLAFKQSNRGDQVIVSKLHTLNVDKAKDLRTKTKSKNNTIYYFMRSILCMRKEQFQPVLAKDVKIPSVFIPKMRKIFAWVFCFIVIISMSFLIILTGLKFGKVKSLRWITSIGMSLGEDSLIVDPGKIILISIIFCLLQAQFCDLYGYDQKIDEMKDKIKKVHVKRDHFIHKMRKRRMYKLISEERMNKVLEQKYKIQTWWLLVNILDICFLFVVLFSIISIAMIGKYYCDSYFLKVLSRNVNLKASKDIMSIHNYSVFLQSDVFPSIYSTEWYNGRPLTVGSELFAETGWTLDAAHRLMGVPRLRQIRTRKHHCLLPSILGNLTIYCNVKYSPSTEDTDVHGAQWRNVSWDDTLFGITSWKYCDPDLNSSVGITSDSGEWFHGGGYISDMGRSQRKSTDKLLYLLETDWLDIRTRVVFFEMTTYNVNKGEFTSIMYITEHLESTLIMSGERVWSEKIWKEDILMEIGFLIFTVIEITKLIMLLNDGGLYLFVTSFWVVCDFCLIFLGLVFFVVYRVVIITTSVNSSDVQQSGEEKFIQLDTLHRHLYIEQIIIGFLFTFASIRFLRLYKYENTFPVLEKQRHTLHFFWPKISWMTLILILALFSLQRLVLYTVNYLYPISISHLMLYKMNFNYLHSSVLSAEKNIFLFLPCFISSIAVIIFMLVLITSYTAAQQKFNIKYANRREIK